MYQLKLEFNIKEYPYKEEPYDPNICWAEISLSVVSAGAETIKEILKIEWDISVLLQWLTENEKKILNENFPLDKNKKCSLAEKSHRFYDVEEDLDEDEIDLMYNYRESHELWFGLRGTDIDDVLIGKGDKGYEVSHFSESNSWCYQVDLERFFKEVKRLEVS